MLYVGLDLSRKRLDWLALDRDGEPGGVAPSRLTGIAWRGWADDWAMDRCWP